MASYVCAKQGFPNDPPPLLRHVLLCILRCHVRHCASTRKSITSSVEGDAGEAVFVCHCTPVVMSYFACTRLCMHLFIFFLCGHAGVYLCTYSIFPLHVLCLTSKS